MIPPLDLTRQYSALKAEIDAAIARVVSSQHFVLGEEVAAFERELAAYLGVKHAIGVASGSDALALSLMALGVGPGDRVLTTPFTFFATAGAIARIGATPVFADIDEATLNLDPAKARDTLRRDKVRAMIPVHLFGYPADVEAFEQLGAEFGVPVVEDAAQAIGARARSRALGTIGQLGCFSFFPSKTLGAYGDGGAVTTNDDALAATVRKLRVHGSSAKYIHDVVGLNSRIDALQAAVLRAKLPRVDAWVSARRAVAARYSTGLRNLPVTLPPDAAKGPENATHAFHQFTIRVRAPHSRDALQEHLAAHGVGTTVYYPVPLHLQVCFKGLGYREGAFPVSERATREVLSLPMFAELSPEETDQITRSVRAFFVEERATTSGTSVG